MKVAIIGGTSTDTQPPTDYKSELCKFINDVEFDEIRLDYLLFEISKNSFEIYDWRNKNKLSQYDLILIRGVVKNHLDCAYAISRYAVINNIRIVNDFSMHASTSKFVQSIIFYELNVPFLPTLYSINNRYLLEATDSLFEWPVIIKDSYGAHGNNNYVVKNSEQYINIINNGSEIKYIAQSFCPNDCDYRVLLVGDDYIIIKRTAANGSHLNNTSQGGTAELVNELPSHIIEKSKAIASKLKFYISGIDVLQNSETGEYYFLEVNSQPQLVSGAFVDEKMKLLNKFIKS
jgi:glutathione synthase/RimK-type ligase-like ATP-grasp enzyme